MEATSAAQCELDFPLLALLAPMGPELPSDIRRDSRSAPGRRGPALRDELRRCTRGADENLER